MKNINVFKLIAKGFEVLFFLEVFLIGVFVFVFFMSYEFGTTKIIANNGRIEKSYLNVRLNSTIVKQNNIEYEEKMSEFLKSNRIDNIEIADYQINSTYFLSNSKISNLYFKVLKPQMISDLTIIHFYILFLFLILVLGSLFILFHLHDFFNSLSKNIFFNLKQVEVLKLIGFTFFVMLILMEFVSILLKYELNKLLKPKGFLLESPKNINIDFGIFFPFLIGIMFLTFAYILKKGIELKEDNDLMV